MTTTVFNRKNKSGQATATQSGQSIAVFNSSGIAEVPSASADEYLAEYGGLELAGRPGLDVYLDVAGNVTTTVTVPAGKYWRILSAVHELATDANVADRAVVTTTTTSAPADIEAFTQATQVASATTRYQVVFQDNTDGNLRVEPQGSLGLATKPTAADTITINGVEFEFVAALTAGGANEILIGALIANTQLAMNAAFVDRDNGGTLHNVTDEVFDSLYVSAADFAGDAMVFTYDGPGNAQTDGAITTTDDLSAGGDGFDAGTLGTETAAVGAGTLEGTSAFPAAGIVLSPAQTITFEVTNGVAGDDLDTYLSYIEYDHDIR